MSVLLYAAVALFVAPVTTVTVAMHATYWAGWTMVAVGGAAADAVVYLCTPPPPSRPIVKLRITDSAQREERFADEMNMH